jgi:DNA-binding NarL/FixJ family response regulator
MLESNEHPIRVLLVDDHELVRMGLRSLLERRADVTVVGEAGTAAAAVQAAAQLHPDIVLMDIRLPDGSGIVASREIRSADPAIRILFLTSYADDDTLLGAWLAGAQGFILKQIGSASLIETLKLVMAGRSVFDQGVTTRVQQLLQGLSGGTGAAKGPALSAQEQRVVVLVAEGKTNKEIATDLGLSEKTVKNYLANVFDKLQVTRRSQVAALVARQIVPAR